MHSDFFDYIRITLFLGKYTGIMPIVGLNSRETCRFTWVSIGTWLYVLNVTILTAMVSFQIYSYSVSGFSASLLNPVLFFSIHWINSLILFRFCRKIENFIKNVSNLEKLLPPTWKPRTTMRSVHRSIFLVVYFGISEHIFYTFYSVYMTYQCLKLPEDSGLYLKSYFMVAFNWYFKYFPFSYIIGGIFQILKVQAAIMWFYGGMIITITSSFIKNRFEEFNRMIIDENGIIKKTFKPSWSELQVHYTRLSKVVSIFDAHFGPTVFLTYTCNTLYVCLQIYLSINGFGRKNIFDVNDCAVKHSNDFVGTTFKIHNMLCLFLRTAFVTYVASEAHISTRRILIAMHSAASMDWNSDMKRLMTQIHYSKLGVSGLGFFTVTRAMVLAMVAKVVTYELVLAQL